MAAPRQGKSSRELTQAHKDHIQTSAIINRLQEHILGNAEMSGSQVAAALGLMRKTLPDLKVTELTTDPQAPPVYRVIRSKEY